MWWRLTAILVIAANTWLTLSDAVVRWLQRGDDTPSEAWLPQWVIDLIQSRPDLGDADIHALMWGTATVLVLLAVRHRPRNYLGAVAVWGWSVIVEILQPVVTSTRAFQWGDLLGNTIGVLLGYGLFCTFGSLLGQLLSDRNRSASRVGGRVQGSRTGGAS
jgi:hypothetical protein